MASEMIAEILKAESLARKNEAAAEEKATEIVEEAKERARLLYDAAIEQAKSEAALSVSEAKLSGEGVLKQAEKLADLREKKVINDTEKKYDKAIELVLENLI